MCSNKDNQIPEHLMVRDPYSGQLINMLPLMEFMNQGAMASPGPGDVVSILQFIHDFITLNITDSGENDCRRLISELQQVNYRLVSMRKVFEEMGSYK